VLGIAGELPKAEQCYLNAIAESEVSNFAEVLFRKRLKVIRQLLALSADRAGDQFAQLFRDWVRHHSPDEYRKEACAFASEMARNTKLSRTARETLRFEATGWDCVLNRRHRAGLFRVRIRSGEAGYTLAVWTRPGDRRPKTIEI
jgi:hypothetical protein